MKFVLPLLLLPLFFGCRYTLGNGYAFDYRGTQAKRSESGPIANTITVVQVDHRFGDVQVKTAPNGDSMWTWDLTVWSDSSEEATSWSKQVAIQHHVLSETAAWKLVLPEPPARGLRGVKSSLTLSVPPSVEVRINNRGNVDVRDLAGKVEVRNRHGDVSAQGTEGITEIKNEHGGIKADRIGPASIDSRHGSATVSQVSGELKLHSQHSAVEVIGVDGAATVDGQHGNLDLRDISGTVRDTNQHGRIRVRTASGPIRLENRHGAIELEAAASDIECRNQHGAIKLVLTNAELRHLQVEGSHSSIHARLPYSTAGVDIDVDHGHVSSEVPQVEGSQFTFSTRHGDVRIERVAD